MKHLITSLLMTIFFGLFGQNMELKWSAPSSINLPEGDFFVLTLEGAGYIADNNYLPEISKTIVGDKINQIEVIHATYENCNVLEAKLIDPRFHNSEVIFDIKSYKSGFEFVNQITFIPLRINSSTGLAEKLVSVEYRITYQEQSSAPIVKAKLAKVGGSSILSSGDWYKYKLSTTGIYKITYSQLKSNGIDVDNLDPTTLKMYHNGGGMLPETNSDFRFDDLNEIPITVVGEQDGSFSNGDYILFYGESTHKVRYDDATQLFHHTLNIYDNYAYYFVTSGGAAGERVTSKTLPSSSDGTVNNFDEFKFLESEQVNVLTSGREWYGDSYQYINPRTYNFGTPDLVSSTEITVTSSLMGMIPGTTGFFESKINGKTLGSQTIFGASNSNYGIKGRENKTDFPINSTSLSDPSNLSIEITWDNSNNTTGLGYTNFLEVNYKRKLSTSGSQLVFSSIESLINTNTEYQINSGNSSMVLWDVENAVEPKNIEYGFSGGTLSFIDSSNTLMKYVVSGASNFLSPTYVKKISNQNLHATSGSNELLIIAPSPLMTDAETYASFKNAIGIQTEVIKLEDIYEEFGGGAQDMVAIRDFIKYVYDKGGAELKYVLIFGDASYDPKNIHGENQYFVPIYESYQSLDNISTFSSDDYFGFLDDDEGDWTENYANNHFLNIGIGRLPIKNSTEAQIVIEKLINYVSTQDHLGEWRNSISFVADDGDNALHMKQADDLTEFVEQADSNYNIKKLFLDSYEQITTPGGQNSPAFESAFNSSMTSGNLIVNYTGHGSEKQWAVEQLITQSKIKSMTNKYKLPLFVTATCEFGRYDDPEQISGAESLLFLPNGGAISLVTTTRPVFSSSNFNLNTAFYDFVLTPKNDSTMRTLGEIMIGTKNNSLNGVFNRGFSLLGDPSLTLAYPKKTIAITKINGKTISTVADTIKALQTVTLEGEVQFHSGIKINSYNGEVHVKVFDKVSDNKTLGDEKNSQGDPIYVNYKEQKSVLFDGKATVSNGVFTISFVVPKDISYSYGSGKISMYASPTSGVEDANGYLKNIIIGGSSLSVSIDDSPPEIELYMDDESFVNGSIVDVNSFFIAKIKDDNGINTAGTGIGHEITAILDGDDKNAIILNSYYNSKLDSYQEGEIRYLFEGLSEGTHTITFKVWDTHNNSSSATITFKVSNELEAYNYPNPFSESTTFVVDQSRSGENGVLEIYIINIKGEPETVLTAHLDESSGTTIEIPWSGTKSSGGYLAAGIYFYRVILRYDLDGTTLTKLDRLVKVE